MLLLFDLLFNSFSTTSSARFNTAEVFSIEFRLSGSNFDALTITETHLYQNSSSIGVF